MRRNKSRGFLARAGVWSIALVTMWQAAAAAEVVEGRVARNRPGYIAVVVYGTSGKPYPNELELVVDRYTRLTGVRTVSDFRADTPVSADVRRQENGLWRADRLSAVQKIEVGSQARRPSPTLKDVLGNPVTRGALTGAASGAIASSASGGKAGKGALIGAGVGALFSLFEQILSQPPARQAEEQRR